MPGFVVTEENPELIDVLAERLPSEELIFKGVDLTGAPTFTTKEVATFFFQRSAGWLRWREGEKVKVSKIDGVPTYSIKQSAKDEPGWHKLFEVRLVDANGVNIPAVRPSRDDTANGTRRYSLADIELLAHRFRALNAISMSRMLITINLLLLVGYGYGVIEA